MDSVFANPRHLYSRQEVLARPCPVPKANGVYAWFFKELPEAIPVDEFHTHEGLKLLYVGISPDKQGKPASEASLRSRIRYHIQGNAEGSTLRLSLGVLLASESGFPPRRVGSGNRMTLTNKGEKWLDAWMQDNAFVTWVEHDEPWELEEELLHSLPLPLNIEGNMHYPFTPVLKTMRIQARSNARQNLVLNDTEKRRD